MIRQKEKFDGDIQKFRDALGEPNEYGTDGISLEREDIDGSHAEAETGYMPDGDTYAECFDSLFANFPALSIHICAYSYDEEMTGYWRGANGKITAYTKAMWTN
jgi:hypothetical protein